MKNLRTFLEESPIAGRVTLSTQVVLHRLTLTPEDVSRIVAEGTLTPAGERTCELEIGGQCVARGRVVWRRGAWFFKVMEMNEISGGPSEGGAQ